ncbi:MAG: hypothetical protein KGL39_15890 [Patescibacteria group bacterium]|nr:hypothetical protein [Patescibacteria group bacterium]
MPSNLGSLFSGIAQGYAQGVHQQRQEALAKQAQEQQAAYQQAQIKIDGARAVLNDPNASAPQKEAAQATIQEAISQMGQSGQGQKGGRGKKGNAASENPLAKIFALLQGHQGGGQAPPIPAPSPSDQGQPASPSAFGASPSTPPLPAPTGAAPTGAAGIATASGTGGAGGTGAPATPPVPRPGSQPAYLSGPGGLDRQRQQAEFDMQEAQRQQLVKDKIAEMQANGATHADIMQSVFGVRPTSESMAIPHQISSRPISTAGLPSDAHLQSGAPIQGNPNFNKDTSWIAMAKYNPATEAFDYYYQPVAAPQQSPNSTLGQRVQAYVSMGKSPEEAQRLAAQDTLAGRLTITQGTTTDDQGNIIPIQKSSRSGLGSAASLPDLPKIKTGPPIGHKPITAADERARAGADGTLQLANKFNAAIHALSSDPDAMNTPMDKLASMGDATLYKMGIDPGPVRAYLSALSGYAAILSASAIGGGRISSYMIEQVKPHVPSPSDTPALMIEKVNAMRTVAQTTIQSLRGAGYDISDTGELKGGTPQSKTDSSTKGGRTLSDDQLRAILAAGRGGKGGGGK